MNLKETNRRLNLYFKNSEQLTQRMLVSHQKDLIKIYKEALVNLEKKLQVLSKKFPNPEDIPIRRLEEFRYQIIDALRQLRSDATPKIEGYIKNSFEFSYNETAKGLNQIIGISLTKLPESTINSAVLNKYSKISWKDSMIANTEKAVRTVRQNILSGLIEGKNYVETSKKLSNELNISINKSLRIVRTETHRAVNEGRVLEISDAKQSANNLGYKLLSVWNSAHLITSREAHIALSGIPADEEGNWYFDDGTQTKGPGLSGTAQHDINCYCFLTTELVEI